MSEIDDLKSMAVYKPKGRVYDEFEVGEKIVHHWGRTITEAETIEFSHLTLSYNPLYFNREYAKAHGHRDVVVNPQLVFNVILGLTVEECSEGIAGPFLGVDALTYHRPVYPGDTLSAVSMTTAKRISDNDSNKGVISWHTEGFNQRGDRIVDFRRSNMTVLSFSKLLREGKIG